MSSGAGSSLRTIFHVDMDAFYASVEQRDNPDYRGKPVVVGADPREGAGRGVVAACSYEARRYGIHSALPISQAYRHCPRAIYLRPDFEKYSRVSRQIRAIFHSLTPRVEPLSIDEAFLDVSSRVQSLEDARRLAQQLKRKIYQKQHLTASIGIGPSKFVAKIASDLKKPNGLVLVPAEYVQRFLDPLPTARIWGVGPRTEEKLKKMGIVTIAQLRVVERDLLLRRFGKSGDHLWRLANGIDDRDVITERAIKSISNETTFSEDVSSEEKLEQTLDRLCRKVSKRLVRHGIRGRTVTLKLRYSDFTTITRQISVRDATDQASLLLYCCQKLLHSNRDEKQRIRLIGVSVSSLTSGDARGQLSLFDHHDETVLDSENP